MTSGPFVVNMAKLAHQPGARRREHREGPLEGLRVSGSAVPERSHVAVDVLLESVHGGILVSGTVTAPWRGECRRCLRPVVGEARATVCELFEAHPVEEETYPLVGEQIDLGPMAREAILLELPQAPLCRGDCAGLCPTCGADLNAEWCGHRAEVADPRWSALDVLRDDR